MRERGKRQRTAKTSLLKIDKDCFVDAPLNMEYVRNAIRICGSYGIRVEWIKSSRSRHGVHFYIKIKPAVDAHVANNLQYLLGDDAKRVAFNKARIESGIVEWNKLFERPGVRTIAIYRNWSVKNPKSSVQIQSFRLPP